MRPPNCSNNTSPSTPSFPGARWSMVLALSLDCCTCQEQQSDETCRSSEDLHRHCQTATTVGALKPPARIFLPRGKNLEAMKDRQPKIPDSVPT